MTVVQSRGLSIIGRLAALTLAVATVAGCSGSGKPKPSPLESFTPSQTVRTAWTARLGAAEGPLWMAVNGTTVSAASSDGQVVTLDATTGAERSRASVGAKLSAGTGSDGRFSAVVTTENELVVLDAGQPSWRERLPGRVITAPLVAGERVFVPMSLAFDTLTLATLVPSPSACSGSGYSWLFDLNIRTGSYVSERAGDQVAATKSDKAVMGISTLQVDGETKTRQVITNSDGTVTLRDHVTAPSSAGGLRRTSWREIVPTPQ